MESKYNSSFNPETQTLTTTEDNNLFLFEDIQTLKEAGMASDMGNHFMEAPSASAHPVTLDLYCYGKCVSNRGKIGMAIAIYDGDNLIALVGRYLPNGTRRLAELLCSGDALDIARSYQIQGTAHKINIFSTDGIGVYNLLQRAETWKEYGWCKPQGVIKNIETIQQSYQKMQELQSFVNIEYKHREEHKEGFNMAESISQTAIRQKEEQLYPYFLSNRGDIASTNQNLITH